MTGTLSILTSGGDTTVETSSFDAYSKAVAAFEDALAEGREPSPSGLDGVRSVELTTAIAESIRAGRTVALAP
jgi:predicted dehydrogenase